MSCNCEVCQYSRKVQENLEGLPEDKRKFFEDMYEILVHVEMDRDWYKCIIEGVWPNADDIIQRSRERRKKSDETTESE